MVQRRSGHIVFISSVQGKIAIPYRSACKLSLRDLIKQNSRFLSLIRNKAALVRPHSDPDAASKHASQAYFDCLRAEIDRYGIPVTVISPGYIRTNLSLNAVTGDGSKHGGERINACDRYAIVEGVRRGGLFNCA